MTPHRECLVPRHRRPKCGTCGDPVYLAVTRLAVRADFDQAQFEHELQACKPPSPDAIRAIPLKFIV